MRVHPIRAELLAVNPLFNEMLWGAGIATATVSRYRGDRSEKRVACIWSASEMDVPLARAWRDSARARRMALPDPLSPRGRIAEDGGSSKESHAASLSPSVQTVVMDEASVDPDPIIQLSSWLEGARRAGEPMPEAMAVSTATTEGRPSSRMVLLRGIDERGLVFYTDRESNKGQDLKANPFAAALFHWFKPVHRQVRVTGPVEVVDESLSDAYWKSRPPGSRRSAVASHQSRVIVSRAALEARVAELAEAFSDDMGPPRPSRWGGYRIRPDAVELWEEGADRLHDRLRYEAQSGGWRIERLSP